MKAGFLEGCLYKKITLFIPPPSKKVNQSPSTSSSLSIYEQLQNQNLNSQNENLSDLESEFKLFKNIKSPKNKRFWVTEGRSNFPNLYLVYCDLSALAVTSCHVERLFSKTGMYLSSARAKTSSEVLEALVYLNYSEETNKIKEKSKHIFEADD